MAFNSYNTKFVFDDTTKTYSVYYGVHFVGCIFPTLVGHCFEPAQDNIFRLEGLQAIIDKIIQLDVILS